MMMPDAVEPADAGEPFRKYLRLLVDHNPFYLLSAVCMLFGSYAIFSDIHGEPERFGPLLFLIAVMEIYSLAVLILGLYLVQKRGLARDAGYLLVLELLLLVDVTFLYNECLWVNLKLGMWINLAAATAGLVKMVLITRALGLRLGRVTWAMLALELLLLFALPGILRVAGQGEWHEGWTMYVLWCAVAALLVVHLAVGVWRTPAATADRAATILRQVVFWCIGLLPGVSLVAHLAVSHYVFDVRFDAFDLAPVCLAFAVVWMHRAAPRCAPRFVGSLMTFTAVVLSALAGESMIARWPGSVQWTPLRIMLLLAALSLAYAWWRDQGRAFAVLAAIHLGVPWTGATAQQMARNLDAAGQWCISLGRRMMPDSLMDWGGTAIVAAFVLLGIGAAVSVIRPRSRRNYERQEGDG